MRPDSPRRFGPSCAAHRTLAILLIAILMLVPGEAGGAPGDGRDAEVRAEDVPPPGVWAEVDSVEAVVEVPPGEIRALRYNVSTASLEPVDWVDPYDGLRAVAKEAVDRVEPWLKRDLAVQLGRLGAGGDALSRLIRDCADGRYVDEIAFTVAHTPPEVLALIGQVDVLRQSAAQLYSQDADIAYADLVERTGPDGNFTTVSYLNHTGVWHEQPRDIYYWYLAHARVFWETPALVSGRSFWRKAYFEEISFEDSGTLKDRLLGCANIIEGANASTVWTQMNMEFGYGTNPLQPVQVILERYGSCGQFSITGATALKVAMIPARVCIYPASDHQWNEVFIDGAWMHVDTSNDVAGNSQVKEPELIRRTNSVNFNDAGVFERGWKPYMAATSTFRSDDVVINSIDISAPDPSFSFRESGMTERTGAAPHEYTPTSTVHISIVDSGNDPLEGAYVAIYRMGHNIYDPSQKDYPHFAHANYTNATGQVDFKLGLQGYCSRCDDDHWYGVLVLSRYQSGTDDFFRLDVPEEGREYYRQLTVAGNAPTMREPSWTVKPPTVSPEHSTSITLAARGEQRHRHGEYSQTIETFAFGTTFDHGFPADVDVMVLTGDELAVLEGGGVPDVLFGARDVGDLRAHVDLPGAGSTYLVLSNTDSYASDKVVDVHVDMTALCYPRLALRSPEGATDHSTAGSLVVNGTLWDNAAITSLDVSLDGEAWRDIMGNYSASEGSFEALLDLSAVPIPSGEYTIRVRATDDLGVWRQASTDVFLDADDPQLDLETPSDGAVLRSEANITISGNVSDNRQLVALRVRLGRLAWQVIEVGPEGGAFTTQYDPIDEAGTSTLELEARDGVGRSASLLVPLVLDPMDPVLEISSPEVGRTHVIGDVDSVEVVGAMYDDNGISVYHYRVDGGNWTGSGAIDGHQGMFSSAIPTVDWEDGLHMVELEIIDLAGRNDTEVLWFMVDGTAPSIDILSPVATYDDSQDVMLSGTVDDLHGVEELFVTIDGGPETFLSIGTDGSFASTLPSGSGEVGSHSVSLRALDSLGNEAVLDLQYLVVDVTLPEMAITSPHEGQHLRWGSTVTLTGTATDNVGVDGIWVNVDERGYVDVTDSYDGTFGEWSMELGTSDMDLGPFIIDLKVTDASGNEDVMSVLVHLEDQTDPEMVLVVDPLSPPKVERGMDLTLEGSATDDVGVTRYQYRIDGGPWMAVIFVEEGDGIVFTVPTKGLPAGLHLLDLKAMDARGNSAVATTTFNAVEPPSERGMGAVAIGAIVAAVVVVLIIAYLVIARRRARGEVPEVREPPTGEMEAGETDDVEVGVPAPDEGAEAEPGGTEEVDERGSAELTEGVEEGPQV